MKKLFLALITAASFTAVSHAKWADLSSPNNQITLNQLLTPQEQTQTEEQTQQDPVTLAFVNALQNHYANFQHNQNLQHNFNMYFLGIFILAAYSYLFYTIYSPSQAS